MKTDSKGTMGGNPDVERITHLRIAHQQVGLLPTSKWDCCPPPSVGNPEVGNPDLHSFNCIWHLLQVENTERDFLIFFY